MINRNMTFNMTINGNAIEYPQAINFMQSDRTFELID